MTIIKSMSYVALLTSAIQISEAGDRIALDAVASGQAGEQLVERPQNRSEGILLPQNTNFVCDFHGCLPQDAAKFQSAVSDSLRDGNNIFYQAEEITVVGRPYRVQGRNMAQLFPERYNLPETLINVTIASNTSNDDDFVKYGKLVVESLKAKYPNEMFMFAFRSDDTTRLGALVKEAGMNVVMKNDRHRHRTTMEIGHGVSAEIMIGIFYGANYRQTTEDAQAAGESVGNFLFALWGGDTAPTYE